MTENYCTGWGRGREVWGYWGREEKAESGRRVRKIVYTSTHFSTSPEFQMLL